MSNRIRRLIPAVVLATSAVAAAAMAADNDASSDAMKQHVQEGTKGVSPETTHAKDHETAAQQSQAENGCGNEATPGRRNEGCQSGNNARQGSPNGGRAGQAREGRRRGASHEGRDCWRHPPRLAGEKQVMAAVLGGRVGGLPDVR
jgi:hypothetical protein